MNKKIKLPTTELSEHDRKILDKYTKFYSNYIESNTAKNPVLEDENYDRRQ
ncbi:MAG: hypothetical protein N2489_09875 [Clostridia bacterium]|nr:hypothetical protein [Clostridia bacterium]